MNDAGASRSAILRHRALVCIGSGGVGKTTVAAGIALAAACEGKKTLCLTIDPARRLASALGLEAFPTEQVTVPSDWLRERGVPAEAELTVMMLDAKSTFDDLVGRFAPSAEEAQSILRNRIYGQLSRNLAGTRSYMAMEKVLSVLEERDFDLIVLDTPPSARALDFFDAPERMVAVLDSPATRALVRAVDGGRRFSLKLVAAGLRRGLSALDRITGTTLLEEIAELLSAMNALFGGFSSRARQVGERLRGPEFGYVLVTAPLAPAILDAASLESELGARGLRVGLQVVNRMSPASGELAAEQELVMSEAWSDLELTDAAAAVVEAARELKQRRVDEMQLLERLPTSGGTRRVLVPGFSSDIHRPERLLEIGRRVLAGPA